jgi:MFS family permease
LLLLAETLPRLLGPFAGTLADRAEGRRFMILCDLGQAALIGCVALLLPPFPVLVALVAGASVLSTLFFPSRAECCACSGLGGGPDAGQRAPRFGGEP